MPADISATNTIMTATKECPFTMNIDGPDGERSPRVIPQAECKGCDGCMPIVVRQLVVKRKYYLDIGTVNTLKMINVTIGFVKKRKNT